MSKRQRNLSTSSQPRWEPALMNCPFDDESWKANIQFVVENDVLDDYHIKALSNVVNIPQRRLFNCLYKSDLMEMVSTLGNPKNKKPAKLPLFSEITETVFALMSAEQEIPLPLLAKLIKFGLLHIKDEAIRRKEHELKPKDDKGKHKKGSEKKKGRSGSPGKKGKKTPEQQPPKKDWSTLKKRGADDGLNRYIDDEPDDGPQHYILICGFKKAQLLVLLGEMGIHINGVIKITSESYDFLAKMSDAKVGSENHDEETLSQIHFQRELDVKKLALFWKILPALLENAAPNSKLQDVIIDEYIVTELIYPANWEDPDNLQGYGAAIFNDISSKIYDTLDWERQYLNYLKNVDLWHVPELGKFDKPYIDSKASTGQGQNASGKRGEKAKPSSEAQPLPGDVAVLSFIPPGLLMVDTRYYQELMNCVPMESVSVNLIVHCMLEQVEATEEDKILPSEKEQVLERTDGIHIALAECIADSLQGLYLTEEEEEILSNDFPQLRRKREGMRMKSTHRSEPVLLRYGDDMAVRTNHLKDSDCFCPKEADMALLYRLPSASLLNIPKPRTSVTFERASRLHELCRYATTMEKPSEDTEAITESTVKQSLQLFQFESMALSSVDDNCVLEKSVEFSDNLWDDPYTLSAKKALIDGYLMLMHGQEKVSSDVTEQEKAEKLAKAVCMYSSPKRLFDNYIFTETFKYPVLIQMMEEARQTFPCLDTYHSKRDNSRLVAFHHPMSDKLKCLKAWSSSLHSDVGFRNYLEHVAKSISEWTKVEEQKYEAEMLAKELEKVKLAQAALATMEHAHTPPSARKKSKLKPGRRESPSKSTSKTGAAANTFSTPFIRAGSIKGERELMAKQKEEETRIKRAKEAKRSADKVKEVKSVTTKSSGKLDSKSPSTTAKLSKVAGRQSKKLSSQEEMQENPVEPETPQKDQLPFIGYDVGNEIIHLSGKTSYLYPCDGGTIKVENIDYKQGQSSIKTTLYKDGHVFVTHVLDPANPEADAEILDLLATPQMQKISSGNVEKGDMETLEKNVRRPSSMELMGRSGMYDQDYHSLFSSWSATLCDGMTMSFSSNGPDGVCASAVKTKEVIAKILNDIPPASSPVSLPTGTQTPVKKGGKKSPKNKSPRSKSPRAKSPKGNRKGKDAEKDLEAQKQEQRKLQEELERKLLETREAEELAKRKRTIPKFRRLFTSCPDGLSVSYEIDMTSAGTFAQGFIELRDVQLPDKKKEFGSDLFTTSVQTQAAKHNLDTDDIEFKLLVRQCYRCKTSAKQDAEKLRAKPAMEEVSRLILADGRVIKLMKDGSTKILYGDGTVCFNAGSGPVVSYPKSLVVLRNFMSRRGSERQSGATEENKVNTSSGGKKGNKGRGGSGGKAGPESTSTEQSPVSTPWKTNIGVEAEAGARLEADSERAGAWLTTYMSGEVALTKMDGSVIVEEPLLCYIATDPVTGEVMYSREDKVVRVERPDGSSACDHVDGTRITRYYKELQNQVVVCFVRVECPGFATVTFNQMDSSCVTLFGSGSTMTTLIDGSYQLSLWNGGRLDIANDGNVTYIPQPNNDFLFSTFASPEGVEGEEDCIPPLPMETLGTYLMRQNSNVCCEAIDQEGNVFQVKTTGDISVITGNNLVNTEEMESEFKQSRPDPMQHHPPRLFVINDDGTGTELLRYKDVQEYISDAQLDPSSAVIREPMPEDNKVAAITVMRPHFGNSGDAWILQKQEKDIIPINLKSRNLKHLPSRDDTKRNPGTVAGRGLTTGASPVPPPPPAALEVRQLIQRQPINQDMRQYLATKVMEYGCSVCEQELLREAMKMHESRSTEEQLKARDLLRLVLEFDEEGTPRSPDLPVPLRSSTLSDYSSSSKFLSSELADELNSDSIRGKYEAAIAPPSLPFVPPSPKKPTKSDKNEKRHSVQQENIELRKSLRNLITPPYFTSDQGRAWLQTRANNLQTVEEERANPRADGAKARSRATSIKEREAVRVATSLPILQGIPTFTSLSDARESLSRRRPVNAHSNEGAFPKPQPNNSTSGSVEVVQDQSNTGSASQLNPAQNLNADDYAGSSPITVEVSDSNPLTSMIDLDSSRSGFILTRSLLYDVTGKPRKNKVRLPTSILSDKPGAVPNEKFMRIEDGVRRKVRTSSVAGGLLHNHHHASERGFQLLPPEVRFGVLREGSTYAFSVRARNVGVDLCRFKVKQPPPSTGLKVTYHPGPVAAGMETKLELEIYAMAVGVEGGSGVGSVNHLLEVITESDIIHLPVSATLVLPTYNFDNRSDLMPAGGKAPGVRMMSKKPPSRDAILRPHKMSPLRKDVCTY